MQLVLRRMSGLSLLLTMNADRLITVGMVIGGLFAGAFLGSLLLPY